MKKIIILLSLLLAGCNSLDGVNAGLNVLDAVEATGFNVDTNGVYARGKRSNQKYCEVRTGPYSTAWKKC